MALDRKAPSPPTCSEAAVAIPFHVVNTTKSDAREAYAAAWPGRAGQRCAQRLQRTLLGGPAPGSGRTVRAPARIRAMLDVIGSTRAHSDAMPSKMNDVLANQAARKPAESRAGDCPSRVSGCLLYT